jgi:predicted transcriptional regulator
LYSKTGQESQNDLDVILSVLENPIRRRILRKLAHENNYPLQLSKELNVSQQAVMKHLKVLEESDFVVSYDEPSKKGGPPRRVFTPRKRYCIRIDIGPNTYSEEIQSYKNYDIGKEDTDHEGVIDQLKIEISGKVTGEMRSEIAGTLPAFIDPKLETIRLHLERVIKEENRRSKFLDLSNLLIACDREITQLEDRRRRLIALRERANEEANVLISNISDDPLDKEVLLHLLKNKDLDIARLSDIIGADEKALESLFKAVKKRHFLL